MAKLLYIGTRVRPEILLTVNYLSTRVNKFTEGDWSKAMRCLEYLNSDPALGLKLRVGERFEINLYADASYGLHADGKSHSGAVVRIGGATVYCKSTKQRIVTKSTTEAELVCASDMICYGIGAMDFLNRQGYDNVKSVTLHQDNTSTIKLIETGKSTHQRTRHINIRYFFIKEMIEERRVELVHTRTDQMLADILTKPLQGALFMRLRNWLLGYETPVNDNAEKSANK